MPKKEDLDSWARDYADYQEEMGQLETNATFVEVFGGMFIITIRIGLFLGFCVITYLIGRAIVGS